MQWQELKSNQGIMSRAKVPGGWFVMYRGEGITMAFYPDPEHKWDGHSEPIERERAEREKRDSEYPPKQGVRSF